MYVLDTDVLSQFMRKRPSPAVLRRSRGLARHELYTTAITVMELRYGSARRADDHEFWQRIVREILSRVLLLRFDLAAAVRAGDIQAELEAAGQPIGLADAQIGAIALAHGAILVTGNVSHFARISDLKVENWLA